MVMVVVAVMRWRLRIHAQVRVRPSLASFLPIVPRIQRVRSSNQPMDGSRAQSSRRATHLRPCGRGREPTLVSALSWQPPARACASARNSMILVEEADR